MRKLFCFTFCILFLCSTAFALNVPSYSGYVNDYADLLSKSKAQKLESRLKEYERLTSNEITILIVKSLEGENLEEFSIRVADSWKPGKEGKNNGVLLLISKKDKKIRLEVGDGLTGKLTDLLSGRVIDGEISQKFKDGDFYEGIDNGVSLIIKVIEGEYTQDNYNQEQKTQGFIIAAVIAIIISVFIGAINPVAGGVAGGICGLILGGLFFLLTGTIISVIVMAIIGVIGGLILREMGGGSSDCGGGYYGGGGGGDGGGFSFGGGGFSGGGASGGW
jgi:uncharacterized protein